MIITGTVIINNCNKDFPLFSLSLSWMRERERENSGKKEGKLGSKVNKWILYLLIMFYSCLTSHCQPVIQLDQAAWNVA